jgi:phage tail sheath protein FI
MPDHPTPGVRVDDASVRARSIQGVGTATAGFVGPARYGPFTGADGVITSLEEFERIYGDGHRFAFAAPGGDRTRIADTDNYLWHAVRAFFTEGGRRLHVARVFRPLALGGGDQDLGGPGAPLYADGRGRCRLESGISLLARFPGAAGNLIVDLTVATGPNLLEAKGAADATRGQPALGGLHDRDVMLVVRRAGPPARPRKPSGEELYVAEWDADHRAWGFRGRRGGAVESFGQLGLKVDPASGQGDGIHVVTVTVQLWNHDRVRGLGNWSDLPLDPDHRSGLSPDSLGARFTVNPAAVKDAPDPALVISIDTKADGVSVLLALAPQLLADLPPGGSLAEHLQAGPTFSHALQGGNDGLRPGAAEYAGEGGGLQAGKTGLKRLEDFADIAVVAAPGSTAGTVHSGDDTDSIYGLLIRHAELMRYRIAVLDSGEGQTINEVRATKAGLNSRYAAFYYPWIKVRDPITHLEICLPPSGFVAGLYARNDVERGVWKAPANEIVTAAVGLEQTLDKAQQEILNPEGINCFRYFEGRGFLLWGARTTTSDPEWKYVNLRRYFAYLEQSIDRGTQWVVFEPNGETLWAAVRRVIEDFLLNEWQAGALLGAKAEQAFFVKCDRSTMTQNDLDNGRLVCVIGVAPLEPAEFVIFRIGQWTADHKC